MALVALPTRWRVFFYVEFVLMAVTGISWFVDSDSMYSLFGYRSERELFSSQTWPTRKPMTPQQFAALTAGQVLCLSYSYVILRMLLASKLDSSGFKYLLEAMTIGDVAQVYIAFLAYQNGIISFEPTGNGNQLTYSVVPAATVGVFLSGGFATIFGIFRTYFIFKSLPELEKPDIKAD